MTSILSPRLCAAGAKRSYTLLATARLPDCLPSQSITSQNVDSEQQNITTSFRRSITTNGSSIHPNFLSTSSITRQQQQRQHRNFSKYASVDHSAAYEAAMASSHGQQLQLALEEGRGKDDAPFDPFSAFLDEMGQTVDDIDDEDSDGAADGDDDIEDAEFNEYDNEEDTEEEEDEYQPMYDTTGAPLRPKSERLALRAGYPSGGNFAVISLAGFQHKVTKDDLLVVNKLKPVSEWSVGSTHTIKGKDVLLVANQHKTCVGLPGVAGAEVDVMVEEITRDKTLVIFKKRRRKNSRRKNGFRRQVTFLRVLDVRMPEGEVDADGLSESMAA
ncbi:hypothetical protein ACHAWT_005155 [Skeletonema menzelii]